MRWRLTNSGAHGRFFRSFHDLRALPSCIFSHWHLCPVHTSRLVPFAFTGKMEQHRLRLPCLRKAAVERVSPKARRVSEPSQSARKPPEHVINAVTGRLYVKQMHGATPPMLQDLQLTVAAAWRLARARNGGGAPHKLRRGVRLSQALLLEGPSGEIHVSSDSPLWMSSRNAAMPASRHTAASSAPAYEDKFGNVGLAKHLLSPVDGWLADLHMRWRCLACEKLRAGSHSRQVNVTRERHAAAVNLRCKGRH